MNFFRTTSEGIEALHLKLQQSMHQATESVSYYFEFYIPT